jgi:hypothetical protein
MMHDLDSMEIRLDVTLGYQYVIYFDHPKASKDGKVYLHRLVIENDIGRFLAEDEVVHHKDGNRGNNKKENLQLMTKTEHGYHHHPAREDRECFGCKIIFSPNDSDQKYCTQQCYRKNNHKITWPSLDYLLEQLKIMPMYKLAKQLGVSDVGLKKHIKRTKALLNSQQ